MLWQATRQCYILKAPSEASCSLLPRTSGTSCLLGTRDVRWALTGCRLRIHHTQEWYDLYSPWSVNDLHKFFDRYLYGKQNGWDDTPRIRQSLLGFNRGCIVNRPETSYPPSYVKHKTFFLDGRIGVMGAGPVTASSAVSYQSDSWDDDGAHWTHTFDKYTEFIGFSQAKLYMSCDTTDDLDVYVICRKLDVNKKPLLQIAIPLEALPSGTKAVDLPDLNIFKYVGPNGRLRASQREVAQDPRLTPEQSQLLAPASTFHPHTREDKIPPGQIVCLDIPLWPTGIIFEAGESIRFEVKGHEVTLPEFPALYRVPKNLNWGKHTVHCGPEYPSSITLSLAEEGP